MSYVGKTRGLDEVGSALWTVACCIAEDSGVSEEFCFSVLLTKYNEAVVMARKYSDYGPGSINSRGLIGVNVRLADKVERMWNLLTTKKNPSNESLLDTLVDIANFGTIATMCHRGSWPGAVGEDKHEGQGED